MTCYFRFKLGFQLLIVTRFSVKVSVRTASSAMGVVALNSIGKRCIYYCIDA